MFSLLGKNKNPLIAAIVPSEAGIAIVTLSPGKEKPCLKVCDFSPWNKGSNHEKQLQR